MNWLRVILIFLIVYLIVRAFIMAGSSEEPARNKSDKDNIKGKKPKGVPKGIGEYIDYEEVDRSE